MKSFKKFLKSKGIIITFLVFSLALLKVYSAPLDDPLDIFVVDAPRANSTLTDMSTVRFQLYDDDNETPGYDVALYNTDCLTRVGTIVTNDYSIRSSNSIYTKIWNTNGPLLDRSILENGTYCLKICVNLLNSSEDYSACDMRFITLADNINHPPVISSSLSNSNYLVGQNFYYNVEAYDEDGDNVRFELSDAPVFLQINSSSGEITSVGTLSEVGAFSVVVRVLDGRGGVATQHFSFNVAESSENNVAILKIVSPNSESIFTQKGDNTIVWYAENIDRISKIDIYYSVNAHDWTLIDTLDGKSNEYNWKLDENLETGEFYIKIKIQTEDGKTYESISDKFSIVNETDKKLQRVASIVDVDPSEDSTITNLDVIKMKLVLSKDDGEINEDSIHVMLDEQDISKNCEILADNQLTCDVSSFEIAEGKHKIEAEFEDSYKSKASKVWYFNLEPVTKEAQEDSSQSIFPILLLICIVLSILLLIPWILYLLWRHNTQDEYEESDVDTTQYVDDYNNADLNEYYTVAEDDNVAVDGDTPSDNILVNQDDEDEDDDLVMEGTLGDDFSQELKVEKKEVQESKDDLDLDANKDGQLDEDDIPDWLKDDETSATPTTPGGKSLPPQKTSDTDRTQNGSNPYSDYGLAQKD